MKTKFYYTFLALCLSLCAIGFTSCSDDDDETVNIYNIGMTSTDVVGYAAMNDMALVEKALKAEFEAEGGLSFSIKGDTDKTDKQISSRFNKAVKDVTLKGGWTGNFTYGVTRVSSTGGSKVIASKKFVSPDGDAD